MLFNHCKSAYTRFNRFQNRLYNGLYRVNTILHSQITNFDLPLTEVFIRTFFRFLTAVFHCSTQLHSSVHLISGCLQPSQLSWLPVYISVAPPCLHHKEATDNMLQIIKAHPNWPVYADVFESIQACISTLNMVRHDIC